MGWLIKAEEISNPVHGQYPGSRPLQELLNNGFIVLDKWRGPTSHDVTAMVKNVLGIKQAGHAGTLDPGVSGVLPILVGNACRLTPVLQGLDKEYVGVLHLHKDVDDKRLGDAVKKFTGEIKQTPPLRSAVARKERKRSIYNFSVIDRSGRDVCFTVRCQAGTYIRKLVNDIGLEIGGAHMTELRRTSVGMFTERMAHTIQELKDAFIIKDDSIREIILPAEKAADAVKKIIIKDSAVHAVCNGAPLYTGGILRIEEGIAPGTTVALLTLKGEIVALAKSRMESIEMTKRNGMAAQTDRVVMKKGVYPK